MKCKRREGPWCTSTCILCDLPMQPSHARAPRTNGKRKILVSIQNYGAKPPRHSPRLLRNCHLRTTYPDHARHRCKQAVLLVMPALSRAYANRHSTRIETWQASIWQPGFSSPAISKLNETILRHRRPPSPMISTSHDLTMSQLTTMSYLHRAWRHDTPGRYVPEWLNSPKTCKLARRGTHIGFRSPQRFEEILPPCFPRLVKITGILLYRTLCFSFGFLQWFTGCKNGAVAGSGLETH